jgi:predicted AlkP superfamily phosphohydrolase/phosphomutase
MPDLAVGVLNLPVSYPPMQVNGFVVSGMLTPESAEDYTYPSDLRSFIEQVADGYIVDVDLIDDKWALDTEQGQLAFLDTARASCQKRAKVALALEERYHPDLYIMVFETPDRLQHVLWRYTVGEEEFPGKSPAVQQAVIACYRELDAALGALLDQMGEHAVFLISDHGFCGQHTLVRTNGWLAERGLLAYRKGSIAARGPLRRAFRFLRRWLPRQLASHGRRAFSAETLIDWSRTYAYTGFPMDHGLYVNLRGREPSGIVEPGEAYETLRRQLRDELSQLRDTGNDVPIFRAVYLREEIYHGPYVDLAPDIVFELTSGYKVVTTPSDELILEDCGLKGEGFHEREGIVVIAGPGVLPQKKLEGAGIIDIAPTVMYMLDAAVPRYMDGKVLTDAFSTAHLHQHPPCLTDTPLPRLGETESQAYDEDDLASIEKRLRSLGYL